MVSVVANAVKGKKKNQGKTTFSLIEIFYTLSAQISWTCMKRRQRGEKWLLKVSLSLPIIMGYRCISESECRIPSYSIASQQNHQSWRHITVDNLTPYGNIWKQLIWLILILGSDSWSRPLILLTHDPWFWPLIPILDPESGFLTNDPCSREFSVF